MGQKLFCWKSKEEDKKKRRQKRVIGIGAARIAALLFLLTEDMSQSVALADSWTAAAFSAFPAIKIYMGQVERKRLKFCIMRDRIELVNNSCRFAV